MNSTLAHLLTRLYPRAWRDRYGAEFEALLREGRGGVGAAINVVSAAVCEHFFPIQGVTMSPDSNSFAAVVRQPSALIPMAMSLTALALVLGSIAMSGTGPEVVVNGRPDEGTVAHLWQILMVGQLPVLAFFAIRWLPRAPKPALGVLGLQATAVLSAMAPVFYFNL
jgi:hypothetical protein